ncbi:nuclear transport factor 2 family protein [Actinomadura sp. 9N407]|uniref:nuclear transport factor 2 family protein n=1 Tax=Actinomadura sp. 9N407 TaxID=3375154 RepID=UPI003794FE4E
MDPSGDRALPAHDAEAVVGGLLDRHEVIDALYRFGLGLDLRDRALLVSALAADAELDPRPAAARWGAYGPLMVGRDTIVNLLLGLFLGFADTTHAVTNPRVDVDGDTAGLTAIVQARYLLKAVPGEHVLLTSRFTAALVRDGEGWVMRHIRIETAWYTGDPAAVFCR